MSSGDQFWAALESLHFLRPWWLVALAPVALLVWLQRRADDPVRRFSAFIAPHLLDHLVVDPEGGARRFRPIHLIAVLLILGTIGAAGPSWRRQPSPFAADTAPVVVALDLSQAMDAIDVAPTRLERAKQKIRDFLDARAGAKTGLVAYAGSAHLVLPPTDDAEIFTTFLDALSTPLMPVPGTDATAALSASLETLSRQNVPGTIVTVTSAIEVEPESIASLLAGSPHQMLVLAVGTEQGGPLRRGDDDFVVEGGRRVVSRLDPDQFELLADVAGIYTTRATVDDTDVRRLVGRTQSHLESAIEQDSTQDWEDAGYWLTWPIALLGLFWFRRGWTVRWEQALANVLVVGLATTLAIAPTIRAQDDAEIAGTPGPETIERSWSEWWRDLWRTPDQQGRSLFENGDFAAAADRFEDPYWRGVAAYRGRDWDNAIDSFAGITSPEGSYNLGNAYAQKGEYELAIAAYDQALTERPDWPEAVANRELVVGLIPPEEEAPQGQGEAHYTADQIEFDLDEDQGEDGEVQMQAFSEEQVAEMWLNQLTTSPAGFLRTKFAIQAARAEAEEGGQ